MNSLKELIIKATWAVVVERKARLSEATDRFLISQMDEDVELLHSLALEVVEAGNAWEDAHKLCDTCGHEEYRHVDLGDTYEITHEECTEPLASGAECLCTKYVCLT